MKLLMKEWKLCMHPMGYIMPLTAALILVPGYPYGVCCFYATLAIFFICLTARENHDAAFTLTLPVSRRDAVRARILFCALIEAATLVIMALMLLVRKAIGYTPNPAGLDAGLALIGEGLVIFALFNAVFFPNYFRDILKPGKAFLFASIPVFLYIALECAATYTVGLFRDALDRPDPEHMTEKWLFTLFGFALYLSATFLSVRASTKNFLAKDLSL